jgi:hypothetical protein
MQGSKPQIQYIQLLTRSRLFKIYHRLHVALNTVGKVISNILMCIQIYHGCVQLLAKNLTNVFNDIRIHYNLYNFKTFISDMYFTWYENYIITNIVTEEFTRPITDGTVMIVDLTSDSLTTYFSHICSQTHFLFNTTQTEPVTRFWTEKTTGKIIHKLTTYHFFHEHIKMKKGNNL